MKAYAAGLKNRKRQMKRLSVFLLALGVAGTAYAGTDPFEGFTDSQLEGIAWYTDRACRGGAGEHTDFICKERDEAWGAYEARGYCYWRTINGSEIRSGWRKCTKDDLAAKAVAYCSAPDFESGESGKIVITKTGMTYLAEGLYETQYVYVDHPKQTKAIRYVKSADATDPQPLTRKGQNYVFWGITYRPCE